MRIAIIGAGNVGGGLGTGLAQAGHEVVFGVRDPDSEKTRAALKAAPGSRATKPGDAALDADVVIVALRWDAVPPTVAELPDMDVRVVIDAMNRFSGDPTPQHRPGPGRPATRREVGEGLQTHRIRD